MKRIEHIVVGTDFSAPADRAVDEALDLAVQLGASVTVLHAYEIPSYSAAETVLPATGEMMRAMADAGAKGLDATLARTKGRGVPMRSVLRFGAAWNELDAVAREEGAAMIVVGTHGRRGFSRALLGSVAERTVRTATHPVMVVHIEPEKESK